MIDFYLELLISINFYTWPWDMVDNIPIQNWHYRIDIGHNYFNLEDVDTVVWPLLDIILNQLVYRLIIIII